MKILMLNYEYPPIGGGGSTVCKDLAEMLVKSGNEVTVVTMAFKGLAKTEKCNGVNIHRVSCWRSKKSVCHPWEQMTYCLSAFRYITKKLDMYQYDVIHCHFIIPTGLLALWLHRNYGIRYAVTAHGSDVLGHNNMRFKYLYAAVKPLWISILKNASVITVPSQYLVDKIHETLYNINCTVIPNGIFSDLYKAGVRTKSIVVVARLQKSKGIQDLIEVCSQIDMTGWTVNVLGDGPFRNELERLIDKYNLREKVFLRGYIRGEEYKRYLSEASICFSGSWFESFSLSMLEAMASQNIIIASDIAPHRQLLPADCIYHSREELVEKLKQSMKRRDFVREYDINKYEWSSIVHQYLKIYEQLV